MISRTVLLLAWVLLFASGCALAQDIRTVDGRKHLVHTVKTGQTLYAISRHYAVPVEAITRANPGAAQGLSIGDTLLIPVEAQTRKELKTAPSLAGDELAHTVAKRETLFGIARKYGISETDLLGRNPAARGGLQVGMVLFIPVTKVAGVPPVQTEPAGDHKGTQHLVMP
ncbi:MAG TPA: LysM peptidoglycan-binding domain-containing protein, partial [Flavobacteriales bacterium]|nr:LysM peptidoglycan-binding domain-containing protein [Flavobacteriales bacterium]